jgi:hypothetical protein
MNSFPGSVVLCWALLAGLLSAPSAAWPQESSGKSTQLDFQFFKTKVQPIFVARRGGHARCVACHGGATAPEVFRLQPLSPGSSNWNDEDSRKNFAAASKLVIPGDLKSPLLVHPLAEEAGGDFFHNGGKHFNSQNDPEWQVLKDWVLGQKGS